MANSMATSYFKYGTVKESAGKIDNIKSLQARIERYNRDGNTEWLVDVACWAMIEYMIPSHTNAHNRATASHESPGRYFHGEHNASQRHIQDF